MYIVISIFATYALGIISFEYKFFCYLFSLFFVVLAYSSIKKRKYIYNLVLIMVLILSFVNCSYNSKSVLDKYIDEEINFIAVIKNMNESSNNDSKFNGYNAFILSINGKNLISKENTIIYIEKSKSIGENSVIKSRGSISDINFSKNKALFNYKNYLRSKKIYKNIFSIRDVNVIKDNYSTTNLFSNSFKNYTENLFRANLDNENANIILSIILGDVDYLDGEFYENIKSMGLAHIFAVSGLHIGLLYSVLLIFFKFLGFNRRNSWFLTWALLWIYGFLIGFPVSVMRTLVMFTFLFGSEILYRKYSSLNSIALSAFILTIINPFWIFDIGFQLSFSAALSIIFYSKYIKKSIKTKNKVLNNIYMLIFLQIFTLPVIVYYFNYLPLMSIFYNIILVPVFTLILIVSFILLIFNGIFSYIFIIIFNLLNYVLLILRYFVIFTENLAFNGLTVGGFSIYDIIFYYLCIIFILYFYEKDTNYKKIGLIILISFYSISYILVPISDSSLYINIIDVGQGMFSTLSYKNYDFIIDCGSTSNKELGKYTAVPYLIKKGIYNINGVFISHWDMDHYSALYELMLNEDIKIRNIFSSRIKDDSFFNINLLEKDDYIKIDKEFKINILWPTEDFITDNRNDTSLVIRVHYKDKNILFTGDIESNVEHMIEKDNLSADILLIPHHGSETSSTEEFVLAVMPEIAVASYGKNNYGIPSQEIIKRYDNINSTILTTKDNGEINFIVKNDKLYYSTYIGDKSNNYYELYFVLIYYKIIVFIALMDCIIMLRCKIGNEVKI